MGKDKGTERIDEMPFEQAVAELERIVERLENGDVPLEQAIELFQQGMELSHLCNHKLEQVEQKIEILLEEEGSLVRKPFNQAALDKGELT